jgi:DNA-binding beta-propeller fold protein YncE
MYVMSPNNLNVTVIDGKTGTVTKSVPLQWEPALLHPPPGTQLIVESLAVVGGNFHIKIDHPTELFRTFASTGQLVRAVHANIDVITMTVQGLPDQVHISTFAVHFP